MTTLGMSGEGPDSHSMLVTDTCNAQVNTMLMLNVNNTEDR